MFGFDPGDSRREPIEIGTDGPDSWFFTWLLGVLVPLGSLIYGIAAIVSQRGWLPGDQGNPPLELFGVNAIALGVASVAGALLMHLRFYCDRLYEDVWPITLGRIIGLGAFIGGWAC